MKIRFWNNQTSCTFLKPWICLCPRILTLMIFAREWIRWMRLILFDYILLFFFNNDANEWDGNSIELIIEHEYGNNYATMIVKNIPWISTVISIFIFSPKLQGSGARSLYCCDSRYNLRLLLPCALEIPKAASRLSSMKKMQRN